MKKLITVCDYCGKELKEVYTILPAKLSDPEIGTWKSKPGYEPLDMCRWCMEGMLKQLSPQPLQKRENQAAGADQETVPATPSENEGQQDAADKQQEPAEKKPKQVQNKAVDHGRIVALYKANPPRSIKWIAEDCKCSEQTVVNHLIKEGIYKRKSERKETV